MKNFQLAVALLLLAAPYPTMSQTSSSNAYAYRSTQPGIFLKSWLVAGPVKVSTDTAKTPDIVEQEKFFESDHIILTNYTAGGTLKRTEIDGQPLTWVAYTSPGDALVFDSLFGNTDFAAAYALAEINSDSALTVFLGVGSDDAVKVYVNGKRVHKNWIARGLNADDDVIPVELIKGKNVLVFEVQDMQGGWSLMARFLDKTAISERLIRSVTVGDAEQVATLLKSGADPNYKGKKGITPYQAAMIAGRNQIRQKLVEAGAKNFSMPTPAQLVNATYADVKGKLRPGVAVLVSQNGKVLYKNAFGYRDIKNKKTVTTTTKFRIGSITKQFTASAILRLQEQGKLNLQDKLSKYFPDFPKGGEVTIHHLLTHTSGIHSYTNTDSFLSKVTRPVTANDLYKYITTLPYDFEPGEKYEYNNSGYFLLGMLVEKISGQSFNDFLKQSFFEPAGMKNTGIYTSSLHLAEEAKGYAKTGVGYDTALNWDMSWAGGAGALYSTVEDLDKWNNALYAGKMLSEKSMKAAFTPVVLNNGQKPPGLDYGYGWGMSSFRGLDVTGHSGGLHGFISQLVRYPKENMTVTILTNQMPVEVEMDPNRIAELFLWQKLDTQASYMVAAGNNANLKEYEGRYDLQNGVVMKVTSDGKSLFAQVTGQGKHEIFPMNKDEYFWKVVEAKVKFNRDAEGNVISGNFEQGAFKITALRLHDEKYISVDSAIFRNLVGDYDFGPGIMITVSAAGGKLFAQATNNPLFELKPLSPDEYYIEDLNARILFNRPGGAKAESLKVTMAGTNKIAPRKN